MSKYSINDTTLTAIADSIRSKAGTSDPIQVSGFADAIAAIPTGGSSFNIDWDKDILLKILNQLFYLQGTILLAPVQDGYLYILKL